MKKSRGFIQLPRTFDQLEIFRNPKRAIDFKIYLACYSRARVEGGVWIDEMSNEEVMLEQGQFVFGRLSFARYVNLPPSTVRDSVERLIKDKLIRKDKIIEKHYTIMSVAFIRKGDKAFYFTANEMCHIHDSVDDKQDDMQDDTKNNVRIMDNNNINNKTKIVDLLNYQVTERDVVESGEILELWNKLFGTQYKSLNFAKNFGFWRQTYSLDEIKKAINNLAEAPRTFWLKNRGAPTPTTLFRSRTTKGENADYIDQCLAIKLKVKVLPTKSRYEELKAKSSKGLTNAEMEEFADLTVKYEGDEQ